MTQLPSEKFNVAWFKLAEFVGRKERERAFGIYRLLSHSLNDDGFVLQLEGDLYLAFNDPTRALDSYRRAVVVYEAAGKIFQAASLYEQIAHLQPDALEPLMKTLELYRQLAYEAKIARCAAQLVRLLVHSGNKQQAYDLMSEFVFDPLSRTIIHEAFVRGILCSTDIDRKELEEHITGALQGFVDHGQDKRITTFLASLAALDNEAYNYACTLVSTQAISE